MIVSKENSLGTPRVDQEAVQATDALANEATQVASVEKPIQEGNFLESGTRISQVQPEEMSFMTNQNLIAEVSTVEIKAPQCEGCVVDSSNTAGQVSDGQASAGAGPAEPSEATRAYIY